MRRQWRGGESIYVDVVAWRFVTMNIGVTSLDAVSEPLPSRVTGVTALVTVYTITGHVTATASLRLYAPYHGIMATILEWHACVPSPHQYCYMMLPRRIHVMAYCHKINVYNIDAIGVTPWRIIGFTDIARMANTSARRRWRDENRALFVVAADMKENGRRLLRHDASCYAAYTLAHYARGERR